MTEETERIILQIKNETDFFNKAKLLRFLTDEKDLSIKELSSKLGLKPSYICHILRLNRIPEMIVDGYYSQLISISHLFVLSRIKDKSVMISVYEKILSESLTVAKTEQLVREHLYDIKTEGKRLSKAEIEKFKTSKKTLK